MDKSECKVSVLIAYNDENVALLLQTIIDFKFKAIIDVARNVKEFNNLTSSTRYDIIFMGDTFTRDIYKFIDEFKRQPKNADIALVLFSSYVEEQAYKKSLETDIYDFILKPFSLTQIYSLVNQILFQKGYKEELSAKRKFVRIRQKIPIKYSVLNKSYDYRAENQDAVLEDLSVGGVSFRDNKDININDTILIDLPITNPFDDEVISVPAIIKWVQSLDNDVKITGAEFLDLNHSDKIRVSHVINSV